MLRRDLFFSYPEDLVAVQPQSPPRVMWVGDGVDPVEISLRDLCERIPAGDFLVLNNTKVVKRRIFAGDLEILFLRPLGERRWQVLFPSRQLKIGAHLPLPIPGVEATLIAKGRPQILELSRDLTDLDFESHGELPLPPYIQKAREERHNRPLDDDWYQTAWAQAPGSLASPTASLHFRESDLEFLRARGVQIREITLHVGLGTFLPVTAENLDEHEMHGEEVEIPLATWEDLQKARGEGHHVWALGTTVARSLESAARGMLPQQDLVFRGETRLFMKPGETWRVVDRLLTNFHQPESTLLALVASFHSLEKVKLCYQWAIQNRFRLFSYGDLSVWIK